MFTINNYFDKVKEIEVKKLPANMQEAYAFVREVTENHTTWDYYHSDKDIKSTVDQYLANLSAYARKPAPKKKATPASKGTVTPATEAEAREIAKQFIRPYVLRGESVQHLNNSHMGTASSAYHADIYSNKIHISQIGGKKVTHSFSLKEIHDEILAEGGKQKKVATPAAAKKKAKPKPPPATPRKKPAPVQTQDAKPVERIEDELKFIKRYVLLHGKVKTNIQVLNFINALQRAIIEKRIRKTSAYAEQIRYIQNSLITLYNKMGNSIQIKLRDSTLSEMMQIAGSEKVRLSVAYMKRYIGIQGKQITKEKATRLYNLIAAAINKSKIAGNDPYMERMKRVLNSLRAFVKAAKKDDTLDIHPGVLSGITEALNGCGCGCGGKKCKSGLNGIEPEGSGGNNPPPATVMNSMDFAKMKFNTLGFTGKWRELIGDPSSNFTAMIFGKPKMGKSYLSVDFAGYLARSHGKVLYVAKEEGLDLTLQEKLNDKEVKHPNLFVTGALPEDLADYDFIFLDSVNRLGLAPEDLRRLKEQYPAKSFIYVFQSTKQGNFRGENSFQHDVDVVIEVPEKGKAVQMGRFNQGGEMDIFMIPQAA